MLEKIFLIDGIRYIMQYILCIFDYFWPKQNDLIIFTGLEGTKFNDNSKYLFQKLVLNHPSESRYLWLTRDKDLIKKMNAHVQYRGLFIDQYSINGILTLLGAKYVIYSFDMNDLPISFSKKTITIQLWHGIPIKAIGGSIKKFSRSTAKKIMRSYEKKFTYWIASSEVDKSTTSVCTGLPLGRVIVCGYPRNDILIEQKSVPSPYLKQLYPFLEKTIILYAPTWRDEKKIDIFPFKDYNAEILNKLLEDKDAYLLIRGHYVDDILMKNGEVDFNSKLTNRIIPANRDLIEDVQDLLPFVDILISDYSGIWVDYLLLDRPMIFIPYDKTEYEAEWGLMYDYDEITPGPKVGSFDEFIGSLEKYLNNPKYDAPKRGEIKNMFHKYQDGLAYQRIFDFIVKLNNTQYMNNH